MPRLLLLGIVLLLGLLVLGRLWPAQPAPAARVVVSAPPGAKRPVRSTSAALVVPEPAGTPVVDLLARLESRRQLAVAAPYTYFDSLLIETDSVLRRWPDESRSLLVASLPDSAQPDLGLPDLLRRALTVWETADPAFRLTLTADTNGAQIIVQSVAQLPGIRAGQTNLAWSQDGTIRSAVISLARSDSSGRRIPPAAALAIAVHEVGHALGMPHSPEPGDVMFAVAKTSQLSTRDLATFRLLYTLPLGQVREPRLP